MTLQKHKYKALLCDMDGTIFNSEEISQRAFEHVCGLHGKTFTIDLHGEILGSRFSEGVKRVIQILGIEVSPARFELEYLKRFDQLLEKCLYLKKGFCELQELLSKTNLEFVLVTSSKQKEVERNLNIVGLENPFSAWITSESVKSGKPDPEAYIKGSEAAGASPKECITFEDSFNGVLSASKAGTYVIAIPTRFSTKLDFSVANRVCPTLLSACQTTREILGL